MHILTPTPDVARLPGCGEKIAVLYQQWIQTGELQEISSAATDERLNVLELFYNIWGVGDTTASEFYKKGESNIERGLRFKRLKDFSN